MDGVAMVEGLGNTYQKATARLRETWNAPKMEVKILAVGILVALVVSSSGWMKSFNNVKILHGRLGTFLDTLCPLTMAAFGAYGVYTIVKLLRKSQAKLEAAASDGETSLSRLVARLRAMKRRAWDVMPLEARILVFLTPLTIVLWQTGLFAKFDALSIKGRSMADLIEAVCMMQVGAMMTWGVLAVSRTAISGAKPKSQDEPSEEASSSRITSALKRIKAGCNKCYSEKFELFLFGLAGLVGSALWASGGFQKFAALMAKNKSTVDLFNAICAAELGGVALWGAKRLIWPKKKKPKAV